MPTEKGLPIKYPMITSLPAFANMTAILSTQEDVFFRGFVIIMSS